MGQYNSFVIRIWSNAQGHLHGSIEHVATHARLAFLDPAAVVDFIRNHLEVAPGAAPDPQLPVPGADQDFPDTYAEE